MEPNDDEAPVQTDGVSADASDPIREAATASRAWRDAVGALRTTAHLPDAWDVDAVDDRRGRLWGVHEGSLYALGRRYVRQMALARFPQVESGPDTFVYNHMASEVLVLTTAKRDDAQVASRLASDAAELAAERLAATERR